MVALRLRLGGLPRVAPHVHTVASHQHGVGLWVPVCADSGGEGGQKRGALWAAGKNAGYNAQ